MTVDGVGVPLRLLSTTTSLPPEQAGFSLRVDMHFVGDLPAPAGAARRALAFVNESYAGRFGWREIVVKATGATAVFDTDAYSTSLTAGLTENVQAMPATGPLAERAVALSFVAGPLPEGAQALGPRPGTTDTTVADDAGSADTTFWLARQTRRISRKRAWRSSRWWSQ